MEIKKSEFTISAPRVSMCPKDTKAEYAFIGRSNVGKSSLINMLCNHKGLAKTSATPGKTLLINHFIINNEWYLVDLPGYGFAKRSKTVQKQLEQMISSYILQRQQLANVFVLIDVRHDQQKIDREFVDWLGESGVPFCIVFTKADKLGPVKARMNAEKWMHALEDRWEALHLISLPVVRRRWDATRCSTILTKSTNRSPENNLSGENKPTENETD